MPRYTAKNSTTGETVSFEWTGKKPPTEDDVNRISDEQRQSRISAKEAAAKNSEQSFVEKLMTSPVSDYAMRAANALGLNQPWHPLDSISQAGQGVKELVTGQGPEANPRTAGVGKILHGAMGAVGPPLTAAGYAMAPVPMAAGMLAGNAASLGVNKGVETLAPDTSPEVKDVLSTGAGLLAGGLTGHGVSRAMRPTPTVIPEVLPPETGLSRVPPEQTPPPRTGVNYAYTDKGPFAPRQLPAGPPIEPFTPYGPPTPEPPGPVAPPPESPVPQFNYGTRSTLAAVPPLKQIPQEGEPIPMEAPPVRMPPAGSAAVNPQLPTAIEPPPTIRGLLPPVQAPQDLVSTTRPEPLSPSEVPTVVAPERSPVEQTPPAPVIQQPPITPQPPPAIPTPIPPPQARVTPPAVQAQPPQPPQPQLQAPPPVQPQAPQGAMDIARAALSKAKVQPPVDLQAQLEQARAENAQLKAVPPPVPPAPPTTQAPIKSAAPQTLGPVAPPQDWDALVRGALKKSQDQPTELPPQESAKLQVHNKVLDFIKNRKDANMDQIARNTGAPVVDIRAALKSLQERGLVSGKGGKFNYNKLPGESIEVPPPEAPEGPPEAPPGTLIEPEPQALSPYRQNRMNELQQQIGLAEDEGDTSNADLMREHLQIEEQYAKIEKGNNPEAKQALGSLDQMYQRISELEDKESTTELNDGENMELGKLYGQANKLSVILETFLKSEHGQQGGEQEGPRRNFFQRMSFNRNIENPGRSDVSAFASKLGSANRVLRESGIPGAKEIGEKTPLVEDLKHEFIGTYERRGADIISGLSKPLRVQVGDILDKYADPESARGFDPRSIEAAIKVRDLLDEIHGMFPGGATRGGRDIGYIPNYLTHIQKTLGSDSDFAGILEDLYDYHIGPFKAMAGLFKRNPIETAGTEQPMGQYGVGNPSSPFAERRSGNLEDYERDIARVLPVYIESASKVIYDKPWINQAKQLLAQIPDKTNAKELATAYLRNYARYDAYPGLQRAWDTATGRMMRVVGRSILGFDTRLWTLHTARLFSNIYPELPTKYMAYGAAQTIKSPIKSYTEAGRLGLLPQNIRPWAFKRPMEKVDSISNALSIFDFIPDGVAYHGFKKMYMDQGADPAAASRMAANKTKDVSLRVTPARAAKFFSDDLGPLKPFTQFKQQVFKIAEQYATAPLDAVKRGQYDRLARYIMGVGSMMYMYKKFRISTWHLDPFHLTSFHAAAYERFLHILTEAGKGNITGALEDAGLLLVPGGTSLKKQFEKGPSMFEEEPSGTPPQGQGRPPKLPHNN